MDTTHLQLPLLAAAQAQKHVTHNDALLRLDALVQLSVIDRDLTAPPGSPADGDRYIPASGATGAWDGWDLNIAWYGDGVWTKLVPREGWRVWAEDEDALLVWDGTVWSEITAGGGGGAGRELLTADRTYFVDGASGSDSNDGLSGGAAFATLQKAADTAASIDLGGFTVTIDVANGTYAENVVMKPLVGGIGIIVGDEGTPSNVLVQPAAGPAFLGEGITNFWHLRGMKFAYASPASGDYCIQVVGANIRFQNLDFGAADYHALAMHGGIVEATGNYAISGGAGRHCVAFWGGQFVCRARTVTISGTPAFTTAFCQALDLGIALIDNNTYSGSATGKRYAVTTNAIIQTFGGGATYLPGNVAGTSATGGIYA